MLEVYYYLQSVTMVMQFKDRNFYILYPEWFRPDPDPAFRSFRISIHTLKLGQVTGKTL
jgi:hypothetical protein